MEPLVIFTAIALAGLAASLTIAVWNALNKPVSSERFEEMIKTVTEGNEISVADTATVANTKKKRRGWFEWWAHEAEMSGRKLTDRHAPGRLMIGAAVILGFFGVVVWPSGISGIPLVALGPLIGWGWLRFEQSRRKAAMETQLPILLSSLRTQIQAGMTVQGALAYIAEDLPAPLGDEIRQVRDEMNVNIPLEEALTAMSERMSSRTVQFLVSSIGVAIRSGTDLVPQLVTIEEIVRQRARIAGKIKSSVALAKPTVFLAAAATPFMFVWMMFSTKGYLGFWFGGGLLFGVLGILLYAGGLFWIKVLVSNVENI